MSDATTLRSTGKPAIFTIEFRSIGWWYWLMSAGLLTASVSRWPMGFPLAVGLTVLQILHFAMRTRSIRSFQVQVRLGYLLLLLVAVPEVLRPISWVPTIGTWVQVLFGYCAMARMVALMPWNREQTLSMVLLKHTFCSAPIRGSFMRSGGPYTIHTSAPSVMLTAFARRRAMRRTGA